MGEKDDARPGVRQESQGGHGSADTLIVGHLTALERNVEICAHEDSTTRKDGRIEV